MPIFHRDFVNQKGADARGTFNPEHLAKVGPRLPVQIGIPDSLATVYSEHGTTIPGSVDGYALFDTGASITCVDESVLCRLALSPVGTTNVATQSNPSAEYLYLCIVFPGLSITRLRPVLCCRCRVANPGVYRSHW